MSELHSNGMPPHGEEFYRQLLAGAAMAVVATDAEYRIVCWNDAAGELLAVQPEEMLDKSIYELVPPERHKLLGKLLERTVRQGETLPLEIRSEGGLDREKNLVFVFSPISGKDGPQGVAVWIVDETRRNRLAERLAQAERTASLGTLCEGVAHHFNNIFGGVATFVDFALTSGDPIAMKRALQMTAEAAARASKITQSLLSFACRDTHEADMADLTEVVLTFSHLVERPLAEQHHRLELKLNPVPIIAVEANRMHHVLGNLLTNSEEAMPDGGTVRLSIERTGEEVTLTFADTGCGIAPAQLSLVFEPFFTTKGLLAGGDKANPGLGLSVAHGIITEMGARIEVDSQSDQGATFRIHFPIPNGTND